MFSTMLPEVDDNLPRFADIEGEIIVATPLEWKFIFTLICVI